MAQFPGAIAPRLLTDISPSPYLVMLRVYHHWSSICSPVFQQNFLLVSKALAGKQFTLSPLHFHNFGARPGVFTYWGVLSVWSVFKQATFPIETLTATFTNGIRHNFLNNWVIDTCRYRKYFFELHQRLWFSCCICVFGCKNKKFRHFLAKKSIFSSFARGKIR